MNSVGQARPSLSTSLILDLVERAAILILYAWLVARLLNPFGEGFQAIYGLLLISEGLVIVFLLARRTATFVTHDPADWLLAIAATCGPLLVSPRLGVPWVSPAIAGAVWLAGTLLQVSAKLALGRSFGCVAAHRGLKRGGPYQWVRHPMYLGYMLSHIAFLLMNPSLGNLAIYVLCDAVQLPRILREEQLLGKDPDYQTYREQVRWRVVPGLF